MHKELGPFTLIESALIWIFVLAADCGQNMTWFGDKRQCLQVFFLHPCEHESCCFNGIFMSCYSFGFVILAKAQFVFQDLP